MEGFVLNKRKIVFYTAISLFCAATITLLSILGVNLIKSKKSAQKKPIVPSTQEQQETTVDTLAVNPINFDELKAQNPDVHGWIRIPGTSVDYPILQSGSDLPEDFYLNHNINRDYEFAGCIYIQKINKSDFSDPNTLIYGHNMLNGSMFATLHKFRDANFFKSNKYMYIYTPGHILTYEIFAAYRYDNRHILYYFDFNDKQVFEDYIKFAKSPTDSIVNVRKETNVTTDDRIITLSTCITNDNYRYLVQGVLIDDQETE